MWIQDLVGMKDALSGPRLEMGVYVRVEVGVRMGASGKLT